MSLKEVAERLQQAAHFDQLLPLLREQEVAYLLAHPKVGHDWRNWLVDRLDQFFQELQKALDETNDRLNIINEEVERLKKALAEAEERAKATPFVEEEAPSPSSTEAEPSGAIVEKAEAALAEAAEAESTAPVEPTEAEKTEPTAPTETEEAEVVEPVAQAEAELTEPTEAEEAEVTAKKPASGRSIVALAHQVIRAREEFYAQMQRAYEELLKALVKGRLRISPEAKYVDLERGFAQKAITWLQIRIAKGEMSVEEAVARAKEKGWTEELDVSPEVYWATIEGFRKAGLYLSPTVVVKGERIEDAPREFAKEIEAGELTIEEAVELAKGAGWARPYQASGWSGTGGTLEEILGPEKVQELRELRGRKSPTSTSKKGKKRQ